MSFRSLYIKKAYSSDDDDILNEFYIPVLKKTIEYNRLSGFFSSTSLAIASRGILGLIRNNGTMKLVVSPKLNKNDLEIILDSHKDPEKYIENKMLEELEKLEDEFVKNHVFALGWMIANKKLEIKVAISYNNEGRPLSYEEIQQSGLFHQKIGILKDSKGNVISFSGSINETATGWLENIEEFKVFRSWEPSEEEYIKSDFSKFNKFWNNQSQRIKVMYVPNAVKMKLIELSPKNIEEIDLRKWYGKAKGGKKKIELFQHQKEAVSAWVNNNMKGIFEMATGTGKTFAAFGCLNKAYETNKTLLTVITCPYQHLVQQWRREIDKFGIEYNKLIIADSSNPLWKDHLADLLVDIGLGHINKVIVLTTHRTFSAESFIKILQEGKEEFALFLIGDEVHGLGAEKTKTGLVGDYDLRLGLSATPKRWFDTAGTNIIYNYFGGIVYEFSLKEAISTINPATGNTYLTPYRYIPKFVSLTDEELEEYIRKTASIAKKYNDTKNDKEKDEILERLLFKRADIIKNAVKKYEVLESILDEINKNIEYTIIYCTPQQIDKVADVINMRGISLHRFTMKEGTMPKKELDGMTERDYLLKKFAENKYKVLIAMKCLDEGVDVPPARTAVFMASSGNSREYIQRIGRIIRRYPNKSEAAIYDIVVVPSLDIPPELRDIEWKILNKELKRYEEIAQIAINSAEALELIYKIKNRFRR